ncbi:DUF397 domain-containing protein [Streptosporangium sp. OZ121]|uniref:DUF397 domain-containing protein n=1 Tax=Streptosporangium sp. OZ121 TaxID=3444183 RepID=UPI003F7A0B4A
MTREVADLEWRKSSYSGSGAECVELSSLRHHILIRDSRKPGEEPLNVTDTDSLRSAAIRVHRP